MQKWEGTVLCGFHSGSQSQSKEIHVAADTELGNSQTGSIDDKGTCRPDKSGHARMDELLWAVLSFGTLAHITAGGIDHSQVGNAQVQEVASAAGCRDTVAGIASTERPNTLCALVVGNTFG